MRRFGSMAPALIVVGFLALLLHSMVAGNGRRRTAAEPLENLTAPLAGHITVWSWNVAAKSLRSLLPVFEHQRPAIHVDVDMNGTGMQSRFLLSLSAGTGAPDVMQLQGYEAPRYVQTGCLTDLTEVAGKFEHDFPAASWANCVWNGRVYGIPWDLGPCAVFYKADLFTRYGIDPDRIDTWDDFIKAGRQLLQRSGGRTRMLPLGSLSLAAVYELLLQQLHGQVFDDAGRVVIDSPASRRVLNLMREMIDAGICSNADQFSQEWMAGLSADTIACYPGAVWLAGTFKDTAGDYTLGGGRAWRVMRLPAFDPGGPRVSNLGGSVLVIPNQSGHKNAAWAFIEFALCEHQSQVAQYQQFALFPAYLPALSDAALRQPDSFFGGQPVGELFAENVDQLPVVNRTADWVETTDYLNQSFTAWAAGHEATDTMLAELSEKLSRRLNRPLGPASDQALQQVGLR